MELFREEDYGSCHWTDTYKKLKVFSKFFLVDTQSRKNRQEFNHGIRGGSTSFSRRLTHATTAFMDDWETQSLYRESAGINCDKSHEAGMVLWVRALASHQCDLGFDFRTRLYHVGRVCCWFSSLLREVFLRALRFSLLLKTNTSKFQFDPECSHVWYMSLWLGRSGNLSSRYRA